MKWCWFHEFDHHFDGESDGWMCHTYEPLVNSDGHIRIGVNQ